MAQLINPSSAFSHTEAPGSYSNWLELGMDGASQVVLVVKNPPVIAGDKEIWIQSLGREDPLEEGMATHSSILAWRIPWTEKPGGLQSMG